MNKSRLIAIIVVQLGMVCSLYAQELTLSPYSRYGIGDLFSNTTTRNAGMGGIGVASDNYFSLNRVNPAGYADLVFTTFDISGFSQLSNLRSANSSEGQVTAGFQDIGFGFPSNKNLVLVMGFAPYSAVGYSASELRQITIEDSVYLEENRYNSRGGLNQAYLGLATRAIKNRLRLGVNLKYLFGNTQFDWTNQVLTLRDTIGVPTFQSLSVRQDVYIKGLSGQVGLMYQDTINASKRILWRIGATADYSLNLQGDRFSVFGNGVFSDTTLPGVELSDIVIPPSIGGGFMINRPGYWSFGADFMYQNWSQFQYFGEESALGQQIRAGIGLELTPDPESFNYGKRINYRFGAYWKQSYIQINDQPVQDYGVTLGFGLPAGLKGNSRLNQGRATSRINFSFELGRRGSVNESLPLEELYARIRLGITLNDRWFIRRVVD